MLVMILFLEELSHPHVMPWITMFLQSEGLASRPLPCSTPDVIAAPSFELL